MDRCTFSVLKGPEKVLKDPIAPLLVNIVLQKVVQMAGPGYPKRYDFKKSVQLLSYADDLDMVGRTERDVAMALERIEECHPAGLKLNVEKTKVMKTTRHPEGRRALKLGEQEYEAVQNFVYLGSSVNSECSETTAGQYGPRNYHDHFFHIGQYR